MTFEELLDEIIRKMPKYILLGDREKVEIKKTLYVYITLGKMKCTDERIYWGNEKSAKEVINQTKEDCKDLDILARKKKLTCISISYLYKEILNRLGIECSIVNLDEHSFHVKNVIRLNSGRGLLVDLQQDLSNIQSKRKLEYFKTLGTENFLPERVLAYYLMQIGYIFDERDYRNEKIERVKNRVRSLPIREVISTIVGSSEIFKGIENMEVPEAYIYYKEVIDEILGNNKEKDVYRFPCYILDGKKNPRYNTFCIFQDSGNYRTLIPYLYSKKHGRMLKCDLQTLESLQEDGLFFGSSKLSKGGIKIRKYIQDARVSRKFREENGFER